MAFCDYEISTVAGQDLRSLPYPIMLDISAQLLELLAGEDPESLAEPYNDNHGGDLCFQVISGNRTFVAGWTIDQTNNVAYITSVREAEADTEVSGIDLRAFVREQGGSAPIEDFFAETQADSIPAFNKIASIMALHIQRLTSPRMVKPLSQHPGLTELQPYYGGIEYRLYFEQTQRDGLQVYILYDGLKKNVNQTINQAVIDRCAQWLTLARNNFDNFTVGHEDLGEGSSLRQFFDIVREGLDN